jgi:hypothetical protein
MQRRAPGVGLLLLFIAVATFVGASTEARDRRPDSWTFEVVEVSEADPVGYIISLRPSPPGRDFPRSCKKFVIYAIFDVSSWSEEGQAAVNYDSHMNAVAALKHAIPGNDLVRVGIIDHGFAAIEGKDKCEVASRVFQYVINDGQRAIISFYDEP